MDSRKATIVVDLGFGDSGKGTTVDYLSRIENVSAVVRFNGGGQAAHNVLTPDGRHHTFSQFGSGSFVPNVRTHLSRFVLIDPISMGNEAEHLKQIGCGDPFTRLSVDSLALSVTPFQKAGNRLREFLRGEKRHGSCGQGIGETMADSIAFPDTVVYAADLRDPKMLLQKLKRLQELKREELKEEVISLSSGHNLKSELDLLNNPRSPEEIAENFREIARRFVIVSGGYLKKLASNGSLVFEGSQGVLIDEWHGFHPYTTWSTTTFKNALTLLGEIDYADPVEKLGILRAYFTRHGPGPFPTEDQSLSDPLPEPHNETGVWQGAFRVGWFDMVLARYALAVCGGADALAITHLDSFSAVDRRQVCVAYDVKEQKQTHKQISRLEPKTTLTDISYQEGLRKLVSNCTPIYEGASADNEEYVRLIERSLGVPVTIRSEGPTAMHKRVFLKDGLCTVRNKRP